MTVKGSIDEIRFRNDENGYSIIVLDVEGEPIICVGTFPPITEGEFLSVEGDFVNHPKFGKQFKAVRVESTQPDTFDGLIRYLGSGILKGVGPKTAMMMVSHFKDKVLEVIEFAPHNLTKIKGISKDKARRISEEYIAVKAMRDVIMFLQEHNLTTAAAIKIYNIYGAETEAVIKTNPYKLVDDVSGIGFLKADKIALSIGIKKDSLFRINAGIIYTLFNSGEKNGNTFLPTEELVDEASDLLKLDKEKIIESIDGLIISAKLKTVKNDETEGLMLSSAYRTERGAAVKLVELKEQANCIFLSSSDEINEFERINNITLHPVQREAVGCAVSNGVSIITGGPGTGKTTIIKCILSVFDSHKISYALMAPTGRAAKRMSESTGREASTIHRALMISPTGQSNGEIINEDAVIVDEFSMVDIYLFYNLISRLKPGAKLIIVGDKDQLPSVGAGNVLKDIIESGYISLVNLTEVYRQGEASLIISNAHAINRGNMPELKRTDADFFFTSATDLERIASLTADLAAERIPKYLGCDPSKIQVLSPVKNGVAGTINLNNVLQQRLNGGDNKSSIVEFEQKFKVGDRVMHTTNNYNLEWTKSFGYYNENGEGIFNGDLGYITGIKQDSGEIEVLFEDGRRATYTKDIRNQLILAYAITVHKSQGCEFDAVIMPILSGNFMILTRNLLYTAITRAKKIVVLVGEEYNIKKMVENNYIAKRYSMLKVFILQAKEKFSILFDSNEG